MKTKRNGEFNKMAIEQYIVECIKFDDVSLDEQPIDWKLAKVYQDFKVQMLPKRYDLKRPINEKKLFMDWLQGIPTDLDVEFRTFEQRELLEDWNIEYYYDENYVSDTFYQIVTKVFYELLDRYNID